MLKWKTRCPNNRPHHPSVDCAGEGGQRELETILVIMPVISREGTLPEVIAITELSATGGRFPSPADQRLC